jgi:hypothetical protein
VPDEGDGGDLQHAPYLLHSDNGYCPQRKLPFIFEFLDVEDSGASVVHVKTRFSSSDGVHCYSFINPYGGVRHVLEIPCSWRSYKFLQFLTLKWTLSTRKILDLKR